MICECKALLNYHLMTMLSTVKNDKLDANCSFHLITAEHYSAVVASALVFIFTELQVNHEVLLVMFLTLFVLESTLFF